MAIWSNEGTIPIIKDNKGLMLVVVLDGTFPKTYEGGLLGNLPQN